MPTAVQHGCLHAKCSFHLRMVTERTQTWTRSLTVHARLPCMGSVHWQTACSSLQAQGICVANYEKFQMGMTEACTYREVDVTGASRWGGGQGGQQDLSWGGGGCAGFWSWSRSFLSRCWRRCQLRCGCRTKKRSGGWSQLWCRYWSQDRRCWGRCKQRPWCRCKKRGWGWGCHRSC